MRFLSFNFRDAHLTQRKKSTPSQAVSSKSRRWTSPHQHFSLSGNLSSVTSRPNARLKLQTHARLTFNQHIKGKYNLTYILGAISLFGLIFVPNLQKPDAGIFSCDTVCATVPGSELCFEFWLCIKWFEFLFRLFFFFLWLKFRVFVYFIWFHFLIIPASLMFLCSLWVFSSLHLVGLFSCFPVLLWKLVVSCVLFWILLPTLVIVLIMFSCISFPSCFLLPD